ncbi:Ran-specific GTPase-activating protein 2 [Wickerhamiella sorbophila]|uniref:Ran-specific GTPase-activating protein 2 n=1 Tax=Wickerhamiella sorbophila TaxID=45607 RepID=A0A2T0FMS8_9ASCO|nr:Ran-specific GTPase-activating protein 2 [Wickerhamiella sorbophila]PRT56275.1 Ran-specific GTPase-activating protein 2 [Wickerhamiella sorbophila]
MKRQLSDSEESPIKRAAGEIARQPEAKNGSGGLKAPGATTSGTLFGNFGTFSFDSIKPKADVFGEKSSDNPWAEPAPALGDDTKKDKYAQVELKQQTVQTGEENESTLFTSRARLYALSFADTAAGWKERGVGVLKVNVDDSNRARIVMRSEGLLRVVLNMPLAKNTQINKGFKSSLVTEKFVQIVGIETDVPHKYALKLPSKELATELFEILDARPETVTERASSESTGHEEAAQEATSQDAAAGAVDEYAVGAEGSLVGREEQGSEDSVKAGDQEASEVSEASEASEASKASEEANEEANDQANQANQASDQTNEQAKEADNAANKTNKSKSLESHESEPEKADSTLENQ